VFFPRVVTPNPDNHDKEYSYTCRPPRIVRDFVAFCADDRDFWSPGMNSPGGSDFEPDSRTPDSLYVLPFKGTRVPLEQSNDGRYSHKEYTPEEYAYDFNMSYPDDRHVYAARSGVVFSVNDNFTGGTGPGSGRCRMDDPDHPGAMKSSGNCTLTNRVAILHQDGTMAQYLHLEHHGVSVHLGQLVHRGDTLGTSGDVGDAANKHIHFDVQRAKPDGSGPVPRSSFDRDKKEPTSSIPVTFDRGDDACARPRNNDAGDDEIASTLNDGHPLTYNAWNKEYVHKMPKARHAGKMFLDERIDDELMYQVNACGGYTDLGLHDPRKPDDTNTLNLGDSCNNGAGRLACAGTEGLFCSTARNECGGFGQLHYKIGSNASCPKKQCWTCTPGGGEHCADTCDPLTPAPTHKHRVSPAQP
jgi:Peptidase family M23